MKDPSLLYRKRIAEDKIKRFEFVVPNKKLYVAVLRAEIVHELCGKFSPESKESFCPK